MNKNRKIVFNEDQINHLIDTPLLATAVFQSLKDDPSITTREAFAVGNYALRQLSLFKESVDRGELVEPKSLADMNHNIGIAESINLAAAGDLPDDQKVELGEVRRRRQAGSTNVS
ncbi:hypothetical protein [Microviridae Fen418_41]|uniref:hypothetical protein n=1 Tax=Microviridae Fen418_41 TaxID=1655653 RepID=UPI00063D5673|nr:hypothetical protein [Microviridae Fen418_41]AKI26906.1 hypothetical protein [Microviridae Fen418_41]